VISASRVWGAAAGPAVAPDRSWERRAGERGGGRRDGR
jgi:hypothetical protein